MVNSLALRKVFVVLLLMLPISKLWSQVIDTVYVGEGNQGYNVVEHPGSTYLWTVEGNMITAGQGTNIIRVGTWNQPGLFPVKIVEQNQSGCYGDTVYAFVLVRENEGFKVTYPSQVCMGDTVTLMATGGTSYLWNNGSIDSLLRVIILSDTNFSVNISNGKMSQDFSLNIKAIPKPVIDFTASVTDFYTDEKISLTYFGNDDDRVLWEIQNKSYRSNTVNVWFENPGYTDIKLIVTNKDGCTDTSVKTINVSSDHLFIPNAFTPNGDGKNEVLTFSGITIKEFSINIYDKWGELVFRTNNINEGWNGTVNNTGAPVMDGVYVYLCDAVGQSGKIFSFTGNVTVLR